MTIITKTSKIQVPEDLVSPRWQVEALTAQLAAANEQVRRIRELHSPMRVDAGGPYARTACRVCQEYGEPAAYPCDTVRTLDGERS